MSFLRESQSRRIVGGTINNHFVRQGSALSFQRHDLVIQRELDKLRDVKSQEDRDNLALSHVKLDPNHIYQTYITIKNRHSNTKKQNLLESFKYTPKKELHKSLYENQRIIL
ncbi:hypothetical protein pb186bvf_010494 [Paramecium bursaria]